MQVFEVSEIENPPYMETKEIFSESLLEIINNSKVLILIDHDDKKIWTYFGPKCSLKLQLYGGILAKKYRAQLRMFYRIINMNELSLDNATVKEVLEKQIGAGRAQEINSENYDKFSIPGENIEKVVDLNVHKGLNKKEAIEHIESLPQPENHKSKYMIIGGNFYSYDSEIKTFVVERDERKVIKKIGEMPNGFFFDNSRDYSTRLIIKDNIIQGIEYLVSKEEEIRTKELQAPIFFEEKFQKPGDIDDILNSFDIPEDLSSETPGEVSDTDGELK